MNVNIQPPRIGPQPWEVVRSKLDQALPFANMRETPYYRDAIYEQFSKQEYARRYAALRAKMKEHKLDAVIAAGGPSHWSFGAGMLWLTGHIEWHALCCYVLVPLDGEQTMIYSMGGTHAEAVRRIVEVAVKDVRHSRSGRYAEVMVERLKELKLERGRIGLMEVDPRHEDYMPVNQYNMLKDKLPEAELVDDWSQGVPLGWIKDVCGYWAEQYDWRRREALLNRFSQFTTEIDGLGIHFLHVRSPHPEAKIGRAHV